MRESSHPHVVGVAYVCGNVAAKEKKYCEEDTCTNTFFFFVSLPATKELVPTNRFTTYSLFFFFSFFVAVASESENKWESC